MHGGHVLAADMSLIKFQILEKKNGLRIQETWNEIDVA